MTKTLDSGSHVARNALLPGAPCASTAVTHDDAQASGSKTLPCQSLDAYDKLPNKSNSCAYDTNNLENHSNSLAVEEKSVTNLDDEGLRALLDEAITYKTPKDREGKSKLFNSLLTDAEDEIRKNHAYNASGPARHYSTTAKKRHRQRRQPSSISDNLTHGGSLNDLAKQELYESTKMQRPKTVSTRQREGGSLPCNVNAGASPVDKQYFIEECAKLEQRNNKSYPEKISHEQRFHLDDSLQLTLNDSIGDSSKAYLSRFQSKPTYYNPKSPEDFLQLKIPNCSNSDTVEIDSKDFSIRHVGVIKPDGLPPRPLHDKKLDENGNALAPTPPLSSAANNNNNPKRKSKQKKAEKVICSQEIEGHRADIINNIDELVNYIDGTEDKAKSKKVNKQHTNAMHNEEKPKGNSKRSRKKSSEMLKKSTSMEEISTTKLEDFNFDAPAAAKEKTPLRPTKSNVDRPSRRSAENINSNSGEPAENFDFICVTNKRKNKKRRNSFGSRRDEHVSSEEPRPADFNNMEEASSPSRRKNSSSDGHTDKSADSSDNESIHSLPLDGDNKNQHVSYADIAKNSDRPKWNRACAERKQQDKTISSTASDDGQPHQQVPPVDLPPSQPVTLPVESAPEPLVVTSKEPDTDLTSLQNWPEIRNNKVNSCKAYSMDGGMIATVQDWPSIISNGGKNNAPQMQFKSDNKSMGIKCKPNNINNKVCNVTSPSNTSKKGPVQWNNSAFAEQQMSHTQNMENPKLSGQPCRQQPVAYVDQQHESEDVVLQNTQQVIQQVSEQQQQLLYTYKMPPNIRDVQSIEKMQMRSLQAAQFQQATPTGAEVAVVPETGRLQHQCTFVMIPPQQPPQKQEQLQQHLEEAPVAVPSSEKHRPAVVILSSGYDDQEISTDITFGFGINEQLLNGDVCADFCNRFIQPELPSSPNIHVEKLVNYIAAEWDNCLTQIHTGRVRYYTDDL